MTGSVKQVAWAQDIENKILDCIDKNINLCAKNAEKYKVVDEQERAEMYRLFKQAITNLFASEKMQSAAFVINNRDAIPDANKIIEQATLVARNKDEGKVDVLRKMLSSFL